MNPVSEVLL